MTQDTIALTIVFLAALYTIFMIVKNFSAKNSSHCGGCPGCNIKKDLGHMQPGNRRYPFDSNGFKPGKPSNRMTTKSVNH